MSLASYVHRLVPLLVLAQVLPACAPAAPSRGDPPPEEAGAPGETLDDFVAALRFRDARVESAGTVSQPFLKPEGYRLLVDGHTLQVFQYDSGGAARQAASSISPDGYAVGETRVEWTAPPHWYQHGRLIVLYLGTDSGMRMLLDDVLGHQVAGANARSGSR